MSRTLRLRQSVNLTKAELRTAVDDTDQWIDDNTASYNSALSAAAQANLTAAQKTILFCVVAAMRECPPVYDAVNELGAYLGRKPDVLIVDNKQVGLAGFIRQPGETI